MCDIGKKIYSRRKELGLTLEEVGQAVGVGKSTVRKWENGMIKNMGRDKIAALARVLQISPVDLVPGGYKPPEYATPEDYELLEALHQDPARRTLFDLSRKLKHEEVQKVIDVIKTLYGDQEDDE